MNGTSPDDASPFSGLAAFQVADADRFFGRERETARLVNRLRKQPLVVVTGPPGVGKSSLVRAGVIPALMRSGEGWQVHTLRPGAAPLASLADLLARHSTELPSSDKGPNAGTTLDPERDAGAQLIARLRAQPGCMGAALRARAERQLRRILVFVDQFEELYTLSPSDSERDAFIACLEGVADDSTSPLRAIVTVRHDFMPKMHEHRHFDALMGHATMDYLSPMEPDEMRATLVKPVESAGFQFQPTSLIDTILDDLQGTRGTLPLLQFTATHLWEARDVEQKCLTQHSYDALGGVVGTLARHADRVLASMSSAEKTMARHIFEALITQEHTRAVLTIDDLLDLSSDRADLERVVHKLARARLLVVDTDEQHTGRTVEITHEALIDHWPTLAQWLDEHKQDRAFLARLRAAAREWQASERTEGTLWRGQLADQARGFRERYAGPMSALQAAYLDAVLALAARTKRRLRWLFAGVLTFLSLVASVMTYMTWEQRATNEQLSQETLRLQDFNRMTYATSVQEQSPTLAVATIREVELVTRLSSNWYQLAARLLGKPIATSLLGGHIWRVNWAEFSPDGARMVTADKDGYMRVWRADGSGRHTTLATDLRGVTALAFAPDSRRILTAQSDGRVRVWDADRVGPPTSLDGHTQRVNTAHFSADGTRVVTASDDSTVRVWHIGAAMTPAGVQVTVLHGHRQRVLTARFNRDATRVVSTSNDRTAKLWSIGDGLDDASGPITLAHDDSVISARFNPDGTRVLTVAGTTVFVWNPDDGTQLNQYLGHSSRVRSAVFHPDGNRILSAADDHMHLWTTEQSDWREHLQDLRSASGIVGAHVSAAFSPDGRQLLAFNTEGMLAVYSVTGHRTRMAIFPERVRSARFTPDGRHIISVGVDHTVRRSRLPDVQTDIETRLWRATSWCTPGRAYIRQEAQIEALTDRCRQRVKRVQTLDGSSDQ